MRNSHNYEIKNLNYGIKIIDMRFKESQLGDSLKL